MSIESVKAYIERLKADEDSAKKVLECKDSEERMAFVKAGGYEFTTEEIDAERCELSDDALNVVVGGFCYEQACAHSINFTIEN